ncbi:MAG: glutamate-5-semialdehyde dehydrogenase [Oscillospiraceae bacterium]|nr:glutamate-5-semialdehyde dehydrogenase [Oscillospiraceae bacterium]
MKTADIIRNAVGAKPCLAHLSSEQKNNALLAMAEAIEANCALILAENALDMEHAAGKISDVKLDRLLLTESRIRSMADGIRDVIALPDPVGKILTERTITDGLELKKIAVPLGVIAIIYESRPNVTSDAAALCLKSGNVCILRSGKEAYRSSHAIVKAMREGLQKVGLPEELINILDDTSHESAMELMKAKGSVDLLIPRGGAGLIRNCVENASVPCIETGTGICTVYVDCSADQEMALTIIENAKTQRPSVCNAEEICLVARNIAKEFLPKLKKLLVDDRKADGKVPVELRLTEEAAAIIDGTPASPADFDTEFLDYILAVKVVADVKEAVDHIALHSTHHSEAIITRDEASADYFAANVDSAAVYINASTRFTDGGMFGLGCEMGISTQKIHARGPMGLEELTTYRYVVRGNGQVRK